MRDRKTIPRCRKWTVVALAMAAMLGAHRLTYAARSNILFIFVAAQGCYDSGCWTPIAVALG